jgi:hypothetical protein
MKNYIFAFLILLTIFLTGCLTVVDGSKTQEEVVENVESSKEIKTLEDGTKYLVHPSKIRGGGPPKDGIPSIDNPEFVSMEEADEWIEDNELVLAIEYKGEKRVYPFQIMVWHEIVNDKISGDPIAITYCPLCGSGIAYHRTFYGEEVEFGTSGKLYNSNLVMYDRKTDTYWTQIGGEAIVGELAGQELKAVPIDTVVWRSYKEFNPEALVLSQDTGFDRQYGKDPYGNYYEDTFLMFPVENQDERVHPKTVIFGVEINNEFKAYKEEDLIEKEDIEDEVGGEKIKLTRNLDGTVDVINLNTGEELPKERDFWFAWYAFHPETILYSFE